MTFRISALIIAAAMAAGVQAQKYVGGDISLLTKYEENGAQYADHDGNTIASPLDFFRNEGWNVMRVRLFVDPANASTTEKGEGVCQDLDYVKTLGKRIKDAGFSFMLDLHYSDIWADPAKQWTPKAWLDMDDDELYAEIYSYTKDVLQQLAAAGATPDFIQTGNEISYGMLWGAEGSTANRCYSGSEANWTRFATLLKRAGEACREVCPAAKIIIHTERAANTGVLKNFYTQMAAKGVDYDIIGLSYYPYFHGNLATLETALKTVESAFPEKKIMIVEAGYPYAWEVPGTTFDYTATYPYSDEGQSRVTDDLIALLNKHAAVNGLVWWWPEANEYGLDYNTKRVTDGWYNSSLFDNRTGRATSALASLKNFLDNGTGIISVKGNTHADDVPTYTIDGRRTADGTTLPAGLYIKGGRKLIVR